MGVKQITINESDYESDLSIYNDSVTRKQQRQRKIIASLIIVLIMSMTVTSMFRSLGNRKVNSSLSTSEASTTNASYSDNGKEKYPRLDDTDAQEKSTAKELNLEESDATNSKSGKNDQKESDIGSPNPDIDSTSSKGDEEEDLYDDYNCVGDRVQHEVKLNRGDYICATNGLYMLGLNKNGHFVYRNNTDATVKIFTNEGEQGDQLELTRDATFLIYKGTEIKDDDENIVWVRECSEEVHYSSRCLPDYDCPYLHIHKGGVVVMNWIDVSTGWNEKNIKKIFDLKWNKK